MHDYYCLLYTCHLKPQKLLQYAVCNQEHLVMEECEEFEIYKMEPATATTTMKPLQLLVGAEYLECTESIVIAPKVLQTKCNKPTHKVKESAEKKTEPFFPLMVSDDVLLLSNMNAENKKCHVPPGFAVQAKQVKESKNMTTYAEVKMEE
jgi:hypothetical protein